MAFGGGVVAWLGLAGGLAAAADHHDATAPVIEMMTTNVQGKNVYLPSTIVAVEGRPYTLSIFNTTEIPHGFSITGAGVEIVLQPNQETKVELPPLESGVYRIHCQLHPAHRSGQLLVVEADD